ncbi:MAG: glycosyltransferase family 2 protein [Candidatus Kerfeldbacteria bacterium]|nr:glycosyltransferase family 2 protein [Candidatus Kerfeldbacteria bacterium]
MTDPKQPTLSIVLPVYNEEGSIRELHREIVQSLQPIALSYEVLYVDDGSSDGTAGILRELYDQSPNVRVIRFRRNFGQTAALMAGFHAARGDTIATLDADLQNDPADIPLLLEKLHDGADIVSGWRKDRKDAALRSLLSRIANRLISKMTSVHLHDYGCTLKVYRADVVKQLHLYGEMHRFIPALASWMGTSVTEQVVHHRPRKYGHTKYGFSRTGRVLLDLINVKFLLTFQTRPIQIFGGIGLWSIGLGIGTAIIVALLKILSGEDISGNPLTLVTALLILVGVQFISIGLLGEMIVRTYHESQGKPIYVIKETLDHVQPNSDDSGTLRNQ